MKDVIQEKLELYNCETKEDEENALKEITQEVILSGLEKAGFFEYAYFHGGTCLRIIHGMDRFSEDLDFALKAPNPDFDFSPYLNKVVELMNIYGFKIEISGADRADSNVKSRFLKDDSIKKLLNFRHHLDIRKKIQIKVEVDITPPKGAISEVNYLDFPTDFMIMTHDPPSLLAGKCHALLCRSFIKGRDWYDFLWYTKQKTVINLDMLQVAINQQGPWREKGLTITKEWLQKEMESKVQSLNWDDVRKDVRRFLKPEKQETLALWGEDFFLKKIKKFIEYQP